MRLGENPKAIHMTGCPAMDIAASQDIKLDDDFFVRYKGVGPNLNPHEPYLVVLQHPVTTEYGNGLNQIMETIKAVKSINKGLPCKS